MAGACRRDLSAAGAIGRELSRAESFRKPGPMQGARMTGGTTQGQDDSGGDSRVVWDSQKGRKWGRFGGSKIKFLRILWEI